MNTTTEPTPLAADDPRRFLGQAVATTTSVIAGVTPDQLDLATPCDDLDVRGLLGHLVGVLTRIAAIGRGDDPMGSYAEPTDVPADGWSATWAEAAHAVQAAFTDDASLDRWIELPWRQATAGDQLLGYLNELSVHTWDLATATGQPVDWDGTVLTLALGSIREILPATGRTEMFAAINASLPPEAPPMAPPFGEAVVVPDDAPVIDQLVAYNGRQP